MKDAGLFLGRLALFAVLVVAGVLVLTASLVHDAYQCVTAPPRD